MVVPLGSGLAGPAEEAADEEELRAAERCIV